MALFFCALYQSMRRNRLQKREPVILQVQTDEI